MGGWVCGWTDGWTDRLSSGKSGKSVHIFDALSQISNSYTMGCPPLHGDYPRALASGLSYLQVDNYFIPPTSV